MARPFSSVACKGFSHRSYAFPLPQRQGSRPLSGAIPALFCSIQDRSVQRNIGSRRKCDAFIVFIGNINSIYIQPFPGLSLLCPGNQLWGTYDRRNIMNIGG